MAGFPAVVRACLPGDFSERDTKGDVWWRQEGKPARMLQLQGYDQLELVSHSNVFELWRGKRLCDGAMVLTIHPAGISPGAVRAIESEFALAQQLDPGWALRPVALERNAGSPVLVLEEFPGQPLTAQKVPLSTECFLKTALSIVAAVKRMHEAGIIHESISPADILIDLATGEVRLTGLGFAVHRAWHGQRSLEGMDLAYIAPELSGRLNRWVDSRSDLYSLGVIFYHLLSGNLPFAASNDGEWIYCHLAVQPRLPSTQLPETLSKIILKLLSKSPEERYQSAAGLLSDLERCLGQWRMHGRIELFELGREDYSGQLLLPRRLYGREEETALLRSACQRVASSGKVECVFCSGYSGVGKTALVKELSEPVTQAHGYFLCGKCEQYKSNTPYSTLVQALEDLIPQLLGEGGESLSDWRSKIQGAVGMNGRLITDIIPEIALLIGEQGPVPPLPHGEAQNRFKMVFGQFISVFTGREHPLVLFLDDLQWADKASLEMMEFLLLRPESSNLLLIGAYRQNEVAAGHPLLQTLERIRVVGIQEINLGPLPPEALTQMTADILRMQPEQVGQLSNAVFQKTGGNPFFFIQFLNNLYAERLLEFDWQKHRWRWDLTRIKERAFTDNVVDFMLGQLGKLPGLCRELLKWLACLGNMADGPMLAALADLPSESVEQGLEPAVAAGLLARQGGHWRFLHDRVQQAAYLLAGHEERLIQHLRAARMLWSKTSESELPECLFEIAGHYNAAVALVRDTAEKQQVARLNLLAGRKAKQSAAYAAAANYLGSGCELLAPDAWRQQYALSFELRVELAESLWLGGDLTEAEGHLQKLLGQELANVDRARIHRDLIEIHTTQGRMREAIRDCQQCVGLFGLELPPAPGPERIMAEYQRVWKSLGKRRIEDLLEQQPMGDPHLCAAMEAMSAAIPAAIFTSENFLHLLLCAMSNLSIEHGTCDASASGYVYFATILGPVFGRYQEGYRFGKLAYDLVNKRGFSASKGRVYFMFGDVVNFWTRHMRTNLPYIHSAFQACVEIGDLGGACYCCNHLITTMLALGTPLQEVYEESERRLEFVRRANYPDIADIIISHQRFILNMQGKTGVSVGDGGFDQAEFEQRLERSQMALVRFWHQVLLIQAHVIYGDYAAAAATSQQAAGSVWTSPSHIQVPEFYFYSAIARLASGKESPDYLQKFREWSEHCPENFEQQRELIGAELARVDGRIADAETRFESAICSARRNGFIQIEALAMERASAFYKERGLELIADTYLYEARNCYLRWGALGKVRQLEKRNPRLGALPVGLLGQQEFERKRAESAQQLDLQAVIKASQAISTEIVLPDLLHSLLKTAVESAGARQGWLFLVRDGRASCVLRAGMVEEQMRIETPLAKQPPEALVNYVIRSCQPILIDDASRPNRFSQAFQGHKSRSVLCIPILRQGAPIGVIQLENELLAGAFSAHQIAFLELLAAQSAISLENARLYADLQEVSERLHLATRSAGIGIWDWDIRQNLLVWEETMHELYGLAPSEFGGAFEDWLQRVHPGDRAKMQEAVESALRAGTEFRHEFRILLPDGVARHVRTVGKLFRDGVGKAIRLIGVNWDISEQRQAEEESRNLNAELEERVRIRTSQLEAFNRDLESFSYSVAHDLRAPLRGISGWSKVLLDECQQQLTDEGRRYLGIIQNETERMGELIESLMELSRVSRKEIRREHVDLSRMAGEILLELGNSEPLRKVEAIIAPGLSAEADPVLVRSVLENLLGNAWKFTGKRADARIEFGVINTNGRRTFFVRDNGAGFDMAYVGKLFAPFQRLHAQDEFSGSGVGLATVQRIVVRHGGAVWAESRINEGATFYFIL